MLSVTKLILENQDRWKKYGKIGAGVAALGGLGLGAYNMYKGNDAPKVSTDQSYRNFTQQRVSDQLASERANSTPSVLRSSLDPNKHSSEIADARNAANKRALQQRVSDQLASERANSTPSVLRSSLDPNKHSSEIADARNAMVAAREAQQKESSKSAITAALKPHTPTAEIQPQYKTDHFPSANAAIQSNSRFLDNQQKIGDIERRADIKRASMKSAEENLQKELQAQLQQDKMVQSQKYDEIKRENDDAARQKRQAEENMKRAEAHADHAEAIIKKEQQEATTRRIGDQFKQDYAIGQRK